MPFGLWERNIERRVRLIEVGGPPPGAHASSHASGGADPVTLAESQVTNLVADLAAKAGTAVFTDVANGLAPLSGGGTTKYLRADATWVVPPASGATVKQALVDVGATPTSTASVIVTDAAVTTGSFITLGWGAAVATDENSPQMDAVTFAAVPGTGQFTATISSMSDLIRGTFRLNYVTG